MVSIVEVALSRYPLAGNARLSWYVTFINEKEFYGTVESLGNDNFRLLRNGLEYYFSADKVIYMRPDTE
jgi:hypothetical protein